jgi:2-polyprenyl-3-methyl-5-hydroxy-6-metoxy-1,4-benzoquinol methylase
MENLTSQQLAQEEEYVFPYHYSDLQPGVLSNVDYLSVLSTAKMMVAPFCGQKLLDAGCGDGRFCYELKNENINITGLDYSSRALAFARAFNPSIKFLQGDLSNLSFEKEFDVITLLEILEHIPLDKVEQVRDGLWRALKDDGKIIVSVPSTNQPLSAKHYQHFTCETLVKYFGTKFKLIKIIGHSKSGRVGKRYSRLQELCKLAGLFRNKIPHISRVVNFREKFYKKYLEFCDPCDASRLIAEFRKGN